MSTMKAWRLHSYGGPETLHLDDVPIPVPGPSQVLVSITRAGMNPFDWKIREGYVREHIHLQLPTVLGVDFVGTVAALGQGATGFTIGNRVMSISNRLGCFAQYIVVHDSELAHVPTSLSDDVAMSLPMPGLTASLALEKAGEVQQGMTVLVQGASGICGAFAVQLAKAKGAKVVGTASAKNREYVMALGADVFIDYQSESFDEKVKDVDLILDFIQIGGSTTDRSWKILKPNGALVTVADGSIMGKVPDGYRGIFFQTSPDASRLQALAEKVASGGIQVKIAKVFGRSELVQAMEINKAGGTTGRLVVDFTRE